LYGRDAVPKVRADEPGSVPGPIHVQEEV